MYFSFYRVMVMIGIRWSLQLTIDKQSFATTWTRKSNRQHTTWHW